MSVVFLPLVPSSPSQTVSLGDLSPEHRKAFCLNVYNALVSALTPRGEGGGRNTDPPSHGTLLHEMTKPAIAPSFLSLFCLVWFSQTHCGVLFSLTTPQIMHATVVRGAPDASVRLTPSLRPFPHPLISPPRTLLFLDSRGCCFPTDL